MPNSPAPVRDNHRQHEVVDPHAIMHLALTVDRPDTMVAEIITKLKAGNTLTAAFAGSELNYEQRQHIVRHIGWNLVWRTKGLRRTESVGRITKEEALRLLDSRKSQVEIAALAGVSRQRIQQVEKEAGRHRRQGHTRPLKQLTQTALTSFMLKAKAMLESGESVEAIAEIYQVTAPVMLSYLGFARRRLGTGWMPSSHGRPRSADDLAVPIAALEAHMRLAQELWTSRVPLTDIAREYGWTLRILKKHMRACRERLNLPWFKHRLAPWVISAAATAAQTQPQS